MLTRKQQELLQFIHARLESGGVSPSFDEMKDAIGLKSKSGIHRLIMALEERGFLRRLANRARALEVIRLPSGRGSFERVSPEQASPGRTAAAAPPSLPAALPANDSVEIPLHGRIAAGTPIEALQRNDTTVLIPSSLLGRGTHYALEVSGDSMIEAGILDGDTVIIQFVQDARDGEIVVALVDEEEATLKRYRRKEGRILLQPANREYETQIYTPERVRIQGRLVGLMRQYH